jgi:hypothetical protein
LFVVVAVWFIPESPRFYMANGKDAEALAFLVKYHGNGDPNSRLVRLEIEEMREGIKADGLDKVWWDCKYSMIPKSTEAGLRYGSRLLIILQTALCSRLTMDDGG